MKHITPFKIFEAVIMPAKIEDDSQVNSFESAVEFGQRNDFDVVYAAVLSSGDNLEFASDNQNCNKEIILASINDDIDNFKFSSESIKNDKDFILTILSENVGPESYFFSYISDALMSNKEFILKALECDFRIFEHFTFELQDDLDVVSNCFS